MLLLTQPNKIVKYIGSMPESLFLATGMGAILKADWQT